MQLIVQHLTSFCVRYMSVIASESIGFSCNLRIAFSRFVMIDVTSKSLPTFVSAKILSAGCCDGGACTGAATGGTVTTGGTATTGIAGGTMLTGATKLFGCWVNI